MSLKPHLIVVLVVTLLSACGGGSGSGNTTTNTSTVYSITLDFARVDNPSGLDPFTVIATLRADGMPTAGLMPTVTLSRGSASNIIDLGDGRYQFTVTPTQTGEHEVTVSYQITSITRTALVLKYTDASWEQAMSVPGLVNTAGYEDGVAITPDGQYLFVQTGPQYFSAIFVYNAPREIGGCGATTPGNDRLTPSRCTHPWLDTVIGPYTAPERPGFFDGRFSGTSFLHNSNVWGIGVDKSPFFAYATMFYGFKKQADGSFSQPFYVAFDDANDAIANPFGMSFRMNSDGTATMAFAHNDEDPSGSVDQDNDPNTADVDSGFDVYTLTITPGQNNIIGRYKPDSIPGNPPLRDTFFPATMVNLGTTGTDGIYGTQGNPHLYILSDGSIHSIWTDDEFDADSDAGFISVYTLNAGTFPNGTWQKTVLPVSVINSGPMQRQPFFTGRGLFFTQDVNLMYSAYSGTDTAAGYANANNWRTPVIVLEKDQGDTPTGKIVAIGEPTIADVNGQQTLYFVYGYVRSVDPVTGISDLDMQAGFINHR